jgi:hypothetical protein
VTHAFYDRFLQIKAVVIDNTKEKSLDADKFNVIGSTLHIHKNENERIAGSQ